ncbi:hypothetical protein RUM44_004139 [Polyplax serrata]|uniref:G-protein coupled receptors family 1 profile domain-containing protein n=1 Tax=Polyplax serrata TaxID=468196 RepID=A0ABR1B1Z4_POLSC
MKNWANETWYNNPDDNSKSENSTILNSFVENNLTGFTGASEGGATDNWWAILALILVIGTAAGNILVCLAITWERKLQNVTNYFLMSLAITDLMVAILVMPLGILTLVKGKSIPIIRFRMGGWPGTPGDSPKNKRAPGLFGFYNFAIRWSFHAFSCVSLHNFLYSEVIHRGEMYVSRKLLSQPGMYLRRRKWKVERKKGVGTGGPNTIYLKKKE